MDEVRDSAEPLVLHRAAWVVPVNGPPIEDGALVTNRGSILEVGKYRDLKVFNGSDVKAIDHGLVALMPCLVNVHTHLELSLLQGKISLPQPGFSAWLQQVFSHRVSNSQADELTGFSCGQQQLSESGTGLYGDITNGACLLPDCENAFPVRQTFLEVLGFDVEDLQSVAGSEAFNVIAGHGGKFSIAAHACYSTSAALIQQAKEWCRTRHLPFSIHVAEHPAEIEFLQNGSGYCRTLLESLGKWVVDWTPPGKTPVEYLDALGALDQGTILVHAVHMRESDWHIVRQRNCFVCFCPRSNQNLNVGRPSMGKSIRFGAATCLGTDSLASNEDLNLFAEAHHVLGYHTDISPDALLFMATLGGARALQQHHRFGSLERGKQAACLSVSFAYLPPLSRLSEEIISRGNQGEWKWVNYPQVS
jgi:cytosine/adenosine deaminase-related metal-dependent hydrolase